MSADNGIYIAEFDDGFRVIAACAIDNLDYFKKEESQKMEQWGYFNTAPVFVTEAEAITYAFGLYKKHLYVEYGVRIIPHQGRWPQEITQELYDDWYSETWK